MSFIRTKKHLGQHFLHDENIARKIVSSLLSCSSSVHFNKVLEIGAGKGILTKYLFSEKRFETHVIEIDSEAVEFLCHSFPDNKERIIKSDFLKYNLNQHFTEQVAVIGNFPYNISSQILFKILEHRGMIPLMVGMFQKEVAKRIASPPGSRDYGILSVLVQAFYKPECLFNVGNQVFSPPPKVTSTILRLIRKNNCKLTCDESHFFRVVKAAFHKRRKTLKNSLKDVFPDIIDSSSPLLSMRAEQLSVSMFILLTDIVFASQKKF